MTTMRARWTLATIVDEDENEVDGESNEEGGVPKHGRVGDLEDRSCANSPPPTCLIPRLLLLLPLVFLLRVSLLQSFRPTKVPIW